MKAYPSYKEYKPSNVDWLGEIPEHWDVKKLKFLGTALIGLTYSPDDVVDENYLGKKYLVLRSSNIQNNKIELSDTVFVTKEIPQELKVQKDDILICARNGSRLLVGKSARINSALPNTTFGAFMTVFRSKINPFLSFYFNSTQFQSQTTIFLTTTINQLTNHDLNEVWVSVPPLSEQQMIADFLDRETAKIDSLIQKRNDLIKLLQEKRSAVISHAVTKGIDPTVRLKPSNIDWLGEIPEHWDCWKISHGYSEMGSGTTPTSDNDAYYDGNINWVTTSELRENIIVDTAKKVSQDAMRDFSALKKYPSGTLLIAMYGATIGRLGILGVEATINQACCALVKSKVFFNLFLFYWFQAYKKTVIILASGGGQPNISQEKIRSLILPTPPFFEQQKITEFLDRETAKIDSLIKKEEKIIKKMKEYRTALISAAVTGKIDVRGEVSHGA